ncbi:methylmalonyl Co-A mutase-associated GTPase MeaB [Kiloniella sp. b19]|uniref:methylmalonyl Co-A mutase-associated GTPase MeaB n=1 Tax=Kiloniella sp. GXU_MW_B19 TaxID=3141326 RepID=UPI0031D45334
MTRSRDVSRYSDQALQKLSDDLMAGKRRALSKALTLIESHAPSHRPAALKLISVLEKGQRAPALRLGISGAPGAGKSTLIEALGLFLLEQGHRVAVLAVDPSSRQSGGSLLGDKTRMEQLSCSDQAFVRPAPSGFSPDGVSLGGVAFRTRESILLCEAAGYDIVIVETVGVGQSEAAVADLTDLFLFVLSPGAGDDLQNMKKGVMEIPDCFVVNKADGALLPFARRAASDCRAALQLSGHRPSENAPSGRRSVLLCSALEKSGLDLLWQELQSLKQERLDLGAFEERRLQQRQRWFEEELRHQTMEKLFTKLDAAEPAVEKIRKAVLEGQLGPGQGAQELLELLWKE